MENGSLKNIQNPNNGTYDDIPDNLPDKITRNNFITAVKLLIERPNVVNRKVCGFELHWLGISPNFRRDEIIKNINYHINLHFVNKSKIIADILLANGFIVISEGCQKRDRISWDRCDLFRNAVAIVRDIIPKCQEVAKILEVIIIDGVSEAVHFIPEPVNFSPKILPDFGYSFSLINSSITLHALEGCQNSLKCKWLEKTVLPSLKRWASQMRNESNVSMIPSLRLVDIRDYNTMYHCLKSKYGLSLMQIWKGESTDPLKFIYEDIGIAAYLLVLWSKERLENCLVHKQSFLDLGCGNGLLVYLLTSEGHPGMGVDVRKRKIWDAFPDSVTLKEAAIKPSDDCLYPEYDWLIGNHSDELTPWLPIIAAKSGPSTRFFVIPCCAFDLHIKFQRKKSGKSQYSEYLEYIEHIGHICGFKVCRDKLRIPSTKRACLVGQERTNEHDWDKILERINAFISERCCDNEKSVKGEGMWCRNFKAREAKERVRNCTQIGDAIRDEIIKKIVSILLQDTNVIQVWKDGERRHWNKGGEVSMNDVVKFLKPSLKHLKNECGGLQTLIRNHKYIFILEKGRLSLRVPEPISRRNVSSELLKTKCCWFYYNHPDGCILQNESCTYIH